jgi:inorganic pyrophosphatase
VVDSVSDSPNKNLYRDLPTRDGRGRLLIVVEAPRGSEVKIKYDEALGVFVWSRSLTLGMRFPFDFGFVPRTLADDGDGLDALVYADVGTSPGVVVPSRVIGALRIAQQRTGEAEKRNDRLVVVPEAEHRYAHLTDVTELPERVRAEIETFFTTSLALTGKYIELRGWASADEAERLVDEGVRRFAPKQRSPQGGKADRAQLVGQLRSTDEPDGGSGPP